MQHPAGTCEFLLKTGWGEGVEHRTSMIVLRLLIHYPQKTGATQPLNSEAAPWPLHYHMIGLVLNPALDHKANNAKRAIIMLQSTAGDIDLLIQMIFYSVWSQLISKDFHPARPCILKETPRQRRGMESQCLGGQTKLEEMRGQKQMRRDSHERNRK